MRVTIRVPRLLQDKTNGAVRVAVQGATVSECVADLIRQYPGLQGMILDSEGRVLLQWMVYINDAIAGRSDEVQIQLKDGDTIALLPLVAGG
jgi:molybdopterin synthase sulfur carrier subunit